MNNKKKNIAMIVYSHFESDVRVKREAYSLSSEGYNVYCISLRLKNEERYEDRNGVKVIKLFKWLSIIPKGSLLRYIIGSSLFILASFIELLKIKKSKVNFHVIHIHNPPDHLILSGLLFKWIYNATLVLDRHEPFALQIVSNLGKSEESILYKILSAYECIVYKFVDYFIVVNNIEKNDVRLITNNKPVYTIRNSFNNTINNNKIQGRERVENEHHFLILYQGFISERRDIDTLIEAIDILRKKYSDIRCYIIGDGDYLQKSIDMVKKEGFQVSSIFLVG